MTNLPSHQASQPIFFPTTDLYMLLICAKNISLQRQKKGVAKGVVYDKKGVVEKVGMVID